MSEFFRFSDGAVKREELRGTGGSWRLVETFRENLNRPYRAALKELSFGALIGLLIVLILPGCISWCLMAVVSTCLSAILFRSFVGDKKQERKVEVRRKAVLITGCDNGFGRLLAKKLDDRGFHIFACCLHPDKAEAKSLGESSSNRLRVVGMDVTKSGDVEKALEDVTENLGNNKLWAVVCNADAQDEGEFLWTNMNDFQKICDTNYLGTVRVVKAFLPFLCKSKGRVIAVTSAAGRQSFMGMAGYCSSQSAIITFCESLRIEMYKFGVHVVTVEPYVSRTSFNGISSMSENLEKTWSDASEEIKAFYSSDYLDLYKRQLSKFSNMLYRDRVGDVMECLEEAVTAEQPKYSYGPGIRSLRALSWILRNLPKPIYDHFVTRDMMKNEVVLQHSR